MKLTSTLGLAVLFALAPALHSEEIPFSLKPTLIQDDRDGLAVELASHGKIPLNVTACVDVDSVRVRELESGGPIVVEWTDHESGGTGRYRYLYYLLLDPGTAGKVLLHGDIHLAGASGAGNWLRQTVDFAFDGLILERRIASDGAVSPGPGEVRTYQRVDVDFFEYGSGRLAQTERRLLYQVQPGDDLASACAFLHADRRRATNAEPFPAVGQWLEFDLPIPEPRRVPKARRYDCGPRG